MLFYLPYPSWIHPEIIPGLPIRWYGLMYIVAFGITYLLFRYQASHGEIENCGAEEIDDLFFRAIILLLVGARLVSQLVYEGSVYNWTHPWMIFWPFRDGKFVGLAGMSYHGGLIGAVLGGLWAAKKYKRSFFEYADTACAAIPLGYTFGRLGNFINGELWGRVSLKPWAMVFPDAPRLSTEYAWVRTMAEEAGIPYKSGGFVNLPRHPSQLYEALFEGVVLFLVLWFIVRPRRKRHNSGFILGAYLIGYGIARFFIEYFRAPDEQLGYIIKGGPGADIIDIFSSFWNISLGQIFCFCMVVAGVVLIAVRDGQIRKGRTAEK